MKYVNFTRMLNKLMIKNLFAKELFPRVPDYRPALSYNGVRTSDGTKFEVERLVLDPTLLYARVVGCEQFQGQVNCTVVSVLVLYFDGDIEYTADNDVVQVLDLKLDVLSKTRQNHSITIMLIFTYLASPL